MKFNSFLIVLFVALFLSSCKKKLEDYELVEPADQLFDKAESLMKKEKFKDAAKVYSKIYFQDPTSDDGAKAELGEAFALYQNGKYADDRVRSFARYFFERVANKSRDVIAQSIIMEDCNDSSTDQIIKGEKKLGNKNKRKRRNRNKNQNKEQSQDQKENTNKQLSPSKDEANENGPDKDVSKPEEEKKLVDENFSPIKDA
jgi:hypothetical protein